MCLSREMDVGRICSYLGCLERWMKAEFVATQGVSSDGCGQNVQLPRVSREMGVGRMCSYLGCLERWMQAECVATWALSQCTNANFCVSRSVEKLLCFQSCWKISVFLELLKFLCESCWKISLLLFYLCAGKVVSHLSQIRSLCKCHCKISQCYQLIEF